MPVTSTSLYSWWGRSLLWLIFVLSGIAVVARASFGPFQLLVSIASPINAEGFLGLSMFLLLIAQMRRDTPALSIAPEFSHLRC